LIFIGGPLNGVFTPFTKEKPYPRKQDFEISELSFDFIERLKCDDFSYLIVPKNIENKNYRVEKILGRFVLVDKLLSVEEAYCKVFLNFYKTKTENKE